MNKQDELTHIEHVAQEPEVVSRRELAEHLTRLGAGALGAALLSGASAPILAAPEQAPTRRTQKPGRPKVQSVAGRKFRYGMVIDTRRCVGCRACVAACKMENKTPRHIRYMDVLERPVPGDPHDKPRFFARPCYHCENPPCVPVCTLKATYKRKEDGIVVVDYDKCQGLGYCVKACPYGSRYMDMGENYPAVEAGTPWSRVPSPEYGQYRQRKPDTPPIYRVRKCSFCMHLQDANGRYDRNAGRWPACAKTCTGKAIHFGDFMDPKSEVSELLRQGKAIRLKPEAGTQPNVYYLI